MTSSEPIFMHNIQSFHLSFFLTHLAGNGCLAWLLFIQVLMRRCQCGV